MLAHLKRVTKKEMWLKSPTTPSKVIQFGNNKNFPGVKEDFEQNTLVPLHFR